MAHIAISATAANATATTDLMSNSAHRTRPYARRLNVGRFTGSAAAADCSVRILAGSEEVAVLLLSATGVPQSNAASKRIDAVIPANVPLGAVMVASAVTNPVYLELETSG